MFENLLKVKIPKFHRNDKRKTTHFTSEAQPRQTRTTSCKSTELNGKYIILMSFVHRAHIASQRIHFNYSNTVVLPWHTQIS